MGHHMTNLDKELQDEKVDESEGDELEDWEEDPVEALRRRGCHDEYEQLRRFRHFWRTGISRFSRRAWVWRRRQNICSSMVKP